MYDYAELARYRRMVAEHYAVVRASDDPAAAAHRFRTERDRLFLNHPLSALTETARANFQGIPYAGYDPAWRFVVAVDKDVEPEAISGELPEGPIRYQRIGRAHFTAPTGEAGVLSLFWILGYGGGVFVPFRDATNGYTTYGGGRYLYDTIKGADLGVSSDAIVLDFNFAYHPSCFYNPRWVCPLAPPENHLAFAVPVGELAEAGSR
jgi:hypothetical protein